MDRIIGKSSKYLNTAVIVLIADIKGEREILFEKRSANIPQGDELCLPGGRIDDAVDATPEQAVIREACEELGLSPHNIVVHRYLGTLIAPKGVTIDAFVGELRIDSWDEIRPNAAEVHSVFTIPLAWFQSHQPEEYQVKIEVYPFETDLNGQIAYLLPVTELGLPAMYNKPWGGQKLPVYVYRTDYGMIWGITAEIVREFIKDLAS